MKKASIILLLTTLSISATYAQVGINADNSAPHSSAQLDVKSTTKAFYPPRMTTAQKNAIASPQAGAVVFDNTLNQLSFYNGSAWVESGSSLSLPYIGTYTSPIFTPGGSTLDISNNSGTEAIGITGRSNAVVTGAGVYGVANSTSPLTDIAGVSGMTASTNSNGVGVKAFHSGTGSAFLANTTNGIGASLNSTNGYALKTQGKLQFAGNGVGILGIGKFLKSTSANGDAQWADLTPITEVKSNNNNLIYLENTLASNNLAVIAGTTNSSTTGAGISGTASNTDPTTNNAGIRGINKSTNTFGYGIEGVHEGSGIGVFGDGYYGVYGRGQIGVEGKSNHWIAGWGVWGEALGTGVYGRSTGTAGLNYGVYGESTVSTVYNSAGVYGKGKYVGVRGESDGTGMVAIANNSAPTITTYGIEARNYSTNDFGIGVWGSINGGGAGVYGSSESGSGIRGASTSGIGGKFSSTTGYALVTTNGKVGIDTETPAAKLDIRGTSYLSHFYYGDNEDTYLRGGKAGSHVLINDIAGQGNVGVGVLNPAFILDIRGRTRIRHETGSTAGIWYNNSTNGLGAFAGMKTDTETGLFVGGNWRFWVNSGGQGYLNGALIQTSDQRLKKDFTKLSNSLSDIYKINGYHYYWKDADRSQDLQTGLIAQEVQKIFPELVQTNEKGFLSVNYIGLVPHLIEAIKELRNENITLKENQKTVENRLQKLEEVLSAFAKK
jgi:hypothetical protein